MSGMYVLKTEVFKVEPYLSQLIFLILYIFSFVLVALEAFRNKHDALNYVASGGKFKQLID